MEGKLADKYSVAEGTTLFKYSVDEELSFRPGQYFFITLPELNYPDDRGARRHFSIVNSPNEHTVLCHATRMRDSGFKRTLNEMPMGAEVELGPITGEFVLPASTSQPLVFMAGGIGITPYISMLRFISEEKLDYDITLIYSNRTAASSAFLDELDDMSKRLPNFRLVLTMTDDPSWQGEKRRIDEEFIEEHIEDPLSPLYMIAGPPGMVRAMVAVLEKSGVPGKQVKPEDFTGY